MRRVLSLLLLTASLGGLGPTAAIALADDEPAALPATDARYWTPKRHVGVVQTRKFPKARRTELTLFAGVIPNDAFVVHLPVGARVAWHTSEHTAWELSAAAALDVDTSLRGFLEDQDANLSAQIRDRQRARVDAAFVWSPIYGKFAWMNRHVVHVDVSFLAGAGAVYTVADHLSGVEGIRPELLAGAAVRLFLSRTTSLRLEYRQLAYLRADDDSGEAGGLATPSELTIGVAFLFGGGRGGGK